MLKLNLANNQNNYSQILKLNSEIRLTQALEKDQCEWALNESIPIRMEF